MPLLHTRYTPFVIISSHRSGSNYLSSLLSSHPGIMSIGELYNPSVLFAAPGKPHLHGNRFAKIIRDIMPVWFLRHAVYHTYPSRIHAVGFRYFYTHAEGKFKPVLDYLINEKSIRIIHLKRKNLLQRYVSLCSAQKTGIWTVPASSELTQPPVQLHLRPKDCLAYFTSMENYVHSFNRHFRHHRLLEIEYEDLLRNLSREQKRLTSFLEVSPRTLTASTKKLNNKPLRSIISNYDVLKRRFSTTKWGALFDE